MDQRMNQHTERTWKLDFGHVVWQVHGSCCLGCLVGIIIEIHPRTARILDDLGVPRFWETRISMVGEKKHKLLNTTNQNDEIRVSENEHFFVVTV